MNHLLTVPPPENAFSRIFLIRKKFPHAMPAPHTAPGSIETFAAPAATATPIPPRISPAERRIRFVSDRSENRSGASRPTGLPPLLLVPLQVFPGPHGGAVEAAHPRGEPEAHPDDDRERHLETEGAVLPQFAEERLSVLSIVHEGKRRIFITGSWNASTEITGSRGRPWRPRSSGRGPASCAPGIRTPPRTGTARCRPPGRASRGTRPRTASCRSASPRRNPSPGPPERRSSPSSPRGSSRSGRRRRRTPSPSPPRGNPPWRSVPCRPLCGKVP